MSCRSQRSPRLPQGLAGVVLPSTWVQPQINRAEDSKHNGLQGRGVCVTPDTNRGFRSTVYKLTGQTLCSLYAAGLGKAALLARVCMQKN